MNALEPDSSQIIMLQSASPDGYALRAASFISCKQFTRAEEDIHKAIEVVPHSPVGYGQLGNLRLVQKQSNEAEKAFRQALDLTPARRTPSAG
jgi:Tfp pilus assembly protein PilF